MAVTVMSPASTEEQRVILSDVSWRTYESLLLDRVDRPVPRFTYHRGTLELLVILSTKHERAKGLLTTLVDTVADVRGIEVLNAGSMTFKRADLASGFEPDVTFYIQNARQVWDREQINPVVDPPRFVDRCLAPVVEQAPDLRRVRCARGLASAQCRRHRLHPAAGRVRHV